MISKRCDENVRVGSSAGGLPLLGYDTEVPITSVWHMEQRRPAEMDWMVRGGSGMLYVVCSVVART